MLGPRRRRRQGRDRQLRVQRNAGQEDRDGDRIGDACDDDDDGDGVRDVADNCRTTANASQADGDGDGDGDACDGCPVNANIGDSPDGDGIDSACDPDDDNDGVLDGADNCPSVANADQGDLNRNGVGTACDPPSMVTIDPSWHEVLGDPRFRLEREQVVHIPIRVLDGPDGCDWSDPGCLGEIRADTVFDTGVRIVDDSGSVIADDEPGREHVLRFAPGGDAILRGPGSDRVEGPSGRSYWLDLVGTGDRGRSPGASRPCGSRPAPDAQPSRRASAATSAALSAATVPSRKASTSSKPMRTSCPAWRAASITA